MKSISISDKLIFYFVSLGIVVIFIIGANSYYFAKVAILDRTFNQLISLRLEKKNRIEQFFLDRVRDIRLISQSEEIKRIIGLPDAWKKTNNQEKERHFSSSLSDYFSAFDYYQRLFIISRNDTVFEIKTMQSNRFDSIAPDSHGIENLKVLCNEIASSGKTIIQDVTKSKLLIYIGSPVFDEINRVIGFVVLEIPITAINKIMFGYTEKNGLGKTGETYLVGNDYLMRSNSRFHENAVSNIKVASTSVIEAFNGKTGIGIVSDYRNASCLSSYSQVNINGLNWVILAEIDENEAMVPVNSIRNSILLISIIIAASVFVVALLVSRRITLPIKRLQKASEQIGAGNYDISKLAVTSLDEIGQLTETFNEMTIRLKRQSEEIEEEKSKRISSLIDGQELERQRLSRDLHDSLGQSLLAVKIKLEQAQGTDFEKNQQIITETKELLKNTIQEIRNITNNLMPPVLEVFGIEQGLKNLCKDTAANTGIVITFTSENIPETLDARLKIYLYRIAQEAINNITKHAEASEASIRFSFGQNMLKLVIADNGKGFDPAKNDANGNGIMNMKERVQLLKGECRVNASKKKGTEIIFEIPFNQDEQN
ncbi:MAG: HAMP domain-containing protein [Bacteroidales bacterium]|nr:HAMP domain-containing protein [Bacteroidales bacterium]